MDSHCLDCSNISTATQHKMHNTIQHNNQRPLKLCTAQIFQTYNSLHGTHILSLLILNSSMSCRQEVPVSLEFHHNKQLY